MSTLKDVIKAMKEVLLLTDKVERTGKILTDISNELRECDRRLVRLETLVEVAKIQSPKNRTKMTRLARG
ncbi:hypothetical protein [Desulfogranum mediterraneum]|uniref:hypothetical protein n=1 Tax=Desulfogranum mediterraneum TaxID=160661 RepID=UPI0012947FCF|nr:hypothetical protein [Desulfogranum mediterraneum]